MATPSYNVAVIYGRRAHWHVENDYDDVELNRFNAPANLSTDEGLKAAVGIEGKGDPAIEDSHEAQADLVPVDKKHHLGYFSTTALILNKTIGTGIFVSPAVVLTATGSKGISLMLWVVGCFVTWGGLFIYLEYGIRWPVTGGELYYVDNVWTRPFRFFTYIFASMFILVNGLQTNALTFGKEVVLAGSNANAVVNPNLQKFFAIVIVTFVCQLQAYSRSIYIRLSNALAIFKVSLLIFVTVCGWIALGGVRKNEAGMIATPYGTENLSHIFVLKTSNLFEYSLALLNVMRAFLGYENANYVLTEVRVGPTGDERRTFRRAVKLAVVTVCFLYVMVNVAFFAACTTEEIIETPETLALFFEKVFGPSQSAHIASAIVVSLSAMGAMLSLTFANVRVKQEIARMGLVPVPEFWSKTSHRRTPANALILHWIASVVCISITPLENADGFLIMSTFYSYLHTWISIMLGVALLCAWWLPSFRFRDQEHVPWKPKSSSLLVPLAVVYISANAFVLIMSFVPAKLPRSSQTHAATLPWFTGPVAGIAILAFGVLWWAWDLHILPRLGYHFRTEEETYVSKVWEIETLRVNFYRNLDGTAARVWKFWRPAISWCWKYLKPESR